MVKLEDLDQFMLDVQELFGFLMAQEIASNPLTPKDTARMARSFPATFTFDRNSKKITFTTPFYTKFVTEGTVKMQARPFVEQIFHQKTQEILKKSFRIVNKRYKNKGL